MKVCTCFLLFGILADTHSFASNIPASNQRSVNLALETVLEFSNKDKEVDINFLNNVQKFITKVKTVIDKNSNGNNLRRNLKTPKVKTFTEFIQDVIHVLNTYEDTAFADFFNILDEEIRNYHYRGCRFYELTENYEIRKLIAEKLDSIKGKPTSVTKAYINALSYMLKDDNYDRSVKEILNYINSLYRQEAGENFQKVITDLEAYGRWKSKRSNSNLGKIIKNGVRSIIFDHYTSLNTNVRRDVKQRIEKFWKQLKKKPPSRDNIPNVKPYSKSRNNAKNSENIMNEVKKPEPVSRKDLMSSANKKAYKKIEVIKKNENNKNRTDIKQSEYKKAEINQDYLKNEEKQYKRTGEDAVDKFHDIQEKETRLSSQQTGPMAQQRTKSEHQEQSIIDSLSGELFSSIEFYQEPQHNATPYTAVIPVKISQKPSMNVVKIEALNVTTRMPTNNSVKKIWIEESTRRLPKAVLDNLAIKLRGHESRNNMRDESLNKHGHKHKKKHHKDQKKWHGKNYEPKHVKMYGKKYDKKHDKKRMTKHWSKTDTKYKSTQKQKPKQDKKHKNDKTSEPNDPFILIHNRDLFRQNYVRTTDSVFNMEVHQYKKSMGPSRVELKQKFGLSTATTKAQKFLEVLDITMPSKSSKTIKSPGAKRTAARRVKLYEIRRMGPTQQTSPPPPTNSSNGRLDLAVPRVYSKRNKMSSRKSEWHFRKSAKQPSLLNEGMTVEKSGIEEYKTHRYNANRTSSSLKKDPYDIKRIKNLERQLNEVKSLINYTIYTDMVKARKEKHSYRANDDVVKRKQSETRFKSDANMIPNDFKNRTDKSSMAETADNKTERMIENKYVKGKNLTNNEIENDLEKDKKYETRFRSDVNMIPNDHKNRTDKPKIAETADNKTERIIENKYVKGENPTNNKKEDDLEKGEKFETRFRSDVNMIPNDFMDRTDETKVDHDNEIAKVTKQQEIINKYKIKEISLTNIGDVSSKAKVKENKAMMNDHDGDNLLKQTGTQNRKIASLNTSTKDIESGTKTKTTVQPTVAVTTPIVLKPSSTSVSILVATSAKLPDVLQKAEFDATDDEIKNKMAKNTSQVADVSKTTINVTTEATGVINKNVMNLHNGSYSRRRFFKKKY